MKKPYIISVELDLASSDIVNSTTLDGLWESLGVDLSRMDKDTLWASTYITREQLLVGIGGAR